jgi:hypothetical protein
VVETPISTDAVRENTDILVNITQSLGDKSDIHRDATPSGFLSGCISGLEIIIHFYSEGVALDLRRRHVRVADFSTRRGSPNNPPSGY